MEVYKATWEESSIHFFDDWGTFYSLTTKLRLDIDEKVSVLVIRVSGEWLVSYDRGYQVEIIESRML